MKRRLIGAITFIVIFFSLSLNVFAANGASQSFNHSGFEIVNGIPTIYIPLSEFAKNEKAKSFMEDFIFNRENSEYLYNSFSFLYGGVCYFNINRFPKSKISSLYKTENPLKSLGNLFEFIQLKQVSNIFSFSQYSVTSVNGTNTNIYFDCEQLLDNGVSISSIPFRWEHSIGKIPSYVYDVDPYDFFGVDPPTSSTPSSEPSSSPSSEPSSTPSSEPSSTPSSSDESSSSFPSIPTIPDVDDKYLGFSPKTFENIFSAASTSIGSIVTVCMLVLLAYTGIVLVIKLIRYFLE